MILPGVQNLPVYSDTLNQHFYHDLLYWGGDVDTQLGHVSVLGEEDSEIVIAYEHLLGWDINVGRKEGGICLVGIRLGLVQLLNRQTGNLF